MGSHLQKRVAFILIIWVTSLFLCFSVFSQVLPPNFQRVLVNNSWTELTGFRFDSTGQMYVWEKGGKIWVIDTNGVKLPNMLLDISEEVGNWRDHGLNGFVLDPNFRVNGYYYLFYTVDRHYLMNFGLPSYNSSTNDYYSATIARVTRYTADPATNFTSTIPGSRLILLGEDKKTGIPVLHESHSGGQLAFGSDGSLLISTGDGASYSYADLGSGSGTYWSQALTDTIMLPKENVGAFRCQMINSLNGKILRIDPATGNGLGSNPFYDPANPRAAKSRVWALGLRNPFRITVRPGTGSTDINAGDPGAIYIGDVGWNTWEELDVCTAAGQNFGWPLFEGFYPQSSYVNGSPFNQDAPNPLFGIGGCTDQFIKFKDLIIQETLNPYSWPNPCNASQQIPSSTPTFVHTPPSIDWEHSNSIARTGIFVGNNLSTILLNDPNSPVPGPVFNGRSSTGGVWYTGTKYPAQYQNTYFHADFIKAWIKQFEFNSNNKPTYVYDFGSALGPCVYVEYNPRDEQLYYVSYPSQLWKLVYNDPNNAPPVAVASQDVQYGNSPLTVNFTGSNSIDPEGYQLTYLWDFGDNTTSNLSNPVKTYISATPVVYNVKLVVTDHLGLKDSTYLQVHLNNTPPQIQITSFNDGDLYSMSAPSNLPLAANVTDAEHGPSELFYAWQLILHQNQQQFPQPVDTNRITTVVITPAGCDPVDTIWYSVKLIVTDAGGLFSTVEYNLYPACAAPVPDFTADKFMVCKKGSVSFTDLSTGLPDSYQWTFDGGTPATSSLKNPTVTYNSKGVFNVTLVTSNYGGTTSETKTGYITVESNPVAIISPAGDDTICAQSSMVLHANTGNGLTYQWYKHQNPIQGATAPSYTVTQKGSYKVVVTRPTGCSTTSRIKKINVQKVNPEITAIGSTSICNGDSVLLEAQVQGYAAYQWKRNGWNLTGETNYQYYAKTAGKYRVVATDSRGCSKMTVAAIEVEVPCRMMISELASNNAAVLVYPNPSDGDFVINLAEIEPDAAINYEVRDLTGRLVNSGDIPNDHSGDFQIHTELTPGIYQLTIFRNSESIFTNKLMIIKR
ncbi:MAG: PQQ-dependent sugar dehydrogenase [Bacteroidia bacterium]|nr:PQQ-dependent sugar dehydrogenase [Bacteroidia bacterium]MCZ2277151.1 PQQ-dependent sugar dehydrogenase [Bacteroidia bacterium]